MSLDHEAFDSYYQLPGQPRSVADIFDALGDRLWIDGDEIRGSLLALQARGERELREHVRSCDCTCGATGLARDILGWPTPEQVHWYAKVDAAIAARHAMTGE
jgi:hypothetical protein